MWLKFFGGEIGIRYFRSINYEKCIIVFLLVRKNCKILLIVIICLKFVEYKNIISIIK